MARPDLYFDWHEFQDHSAPVTIGSRERLRIVRGFFALLLFVVFARAVQLEITGGEAFRSAAAAPLKRTIALEASRGRIVARDGTVLACDQMFQALAVHYRYLEEPADAQWLRSTARARLPRAERRDPNRVAAEEAAVLEEREALHRVLAELSGLSRDEWRRRTARVQRRVSQLARRVNQRRQARYERERSARDQAMEAAGDEGSFAEQMKQALVELFAPEEERPPAPITIAEQTIHHVVVDRLSPAAVQEITNHPESYPGVRIMEQRRRTYPAGSLAAHLLGHVSSSTSEERLAEVALDDPRHPTNQHGRMGLERFYERQLQGRAGVDLQMIDRRGNVLSTERHREPVVGSDVIITLDLALQQAAERLLDSALARPPSDDGPVQTPHGGAIVVMNVHNGEILAAASAPRFDPNLFARDAPEELQRLLSAAGHPLFDRTVKMAIPPGSVFKTVSAVALLESGIADARAAFHCQGFLQDPDRQRCFIYRHFGIGHGDLTLVDALAQSCNVYFFHFANDLGPAPLVNWARRFGFGRPSGVDLPDEAAGQVPMPGHARQRTSSPWRPDDTQALAVGQSTLTVTPLQVVRMMAAVANGGRLVVPRVALEVRAPDDAGRSIGMAAPVTTVVAAEVIQGLRAETLEVVREGLRGTVADANGTAHETLDLPYVAVSGKTGTAETGREHMDHAWFAGYAPADAPQWAFVVVLEQGGGGAAAATPVARRLIQHMHQLGYFRAADAEEIAEADGAD